MRELSAAVDEFGGRTTQHKTTGESTVPTSQAKMSHEGCTMEGTDFFTITAVPPPTGHRRGPF